MIKKTLTIVISSTDNNEDILYKNLLKQSEVVSDKINIKKIINSNTKITNQDEWYNICQHLETEYVIFLDSSDEVSQQFINIMVQLINNNIDLTTFPIEMIYTESNKSFIVDTQFDINNLVHFPIVKEKNAYSERYIQLPNLWCLWKAELFHNISDKRSFSHMMLSSAERAKSVVYLKNNILIKKIYNSNKLLLEEEQDILMENYSKFNDITLQEFNINDEQIIQFDKIREFCIEHNIKYIKTDQIDDICDWHGRIMPKIEITEDDTLIVSGHSDFPVNDTRFSKSGKKLVKWFGQNIEHNDSRLVGIPIGLTNIASSPLPIHHIIGNTSHILEQNKKDKKNSNMIYLNIRYGDIRDSKSNSEREYLVNLCKNKSYITIEKPNRTLEGYKNYIEKIHSHKMVICPRGNGWDTHRIWESLYLKSIPIVKKCEAYSYFKDLPIIFLDDWNQLLDMNFLITEYTKLFNSKMNLEKLTVDYWKYEISRHIRTYSHRILTSTDENPIYIQFWPSVAEHWKKQNIIPTLAFLSNRDENDDLVLEMKKYGDVRVIKPSKSDIHHGNQAKLARLYIAKEFPDDICTLVDIDYYLFEYGVRWLKSKIDGNLDRFICIGSNGYILTQDRGKFAIGLTTAKGSILHDFSGALDNTFDNWIGEFIGLSEIDGKEDISLPLYKFSDESLYRVLISKWNNNHLCKYVEREDSLLNTTQYYPLGRMDRTNFVYNDNIDYYIDCCPPRPLMEYYSSISDVHRKINIYNPERDISFIKKIKEIF